MKTSTYFRVNKYAVKRCAQENSINCNLQHSFKNSSDLYLKTKLLDRGKTAKFFKIHL